MHAISSYRGNGPTSKQTQPQTHKQTRTHTHRQDRLQYTVPLSLARSVMSLVFLLRERPDLLNIRRIGAYSFALWSCRSD